MIQKFLIVAYFFCLVSLSSLSHADLPALSLAEIPSVSTHMAQNIKNLAQKNGGVGDFFKLKLAEQDLKNKKYKDALSKAQSVNEPLFTFWKNVIIAEAFFGLSKPKNTLQQLKELPAYPNHALSLGEKAYENLYKRAVLIKYHAHTALGMKASAEVRLLFAFFSDHKNLDAIFKQHAPIALSAEERVAKIHRLHLFYKYKEIETVASLSHIRAAKISHEEKCQTYYELANGTRMVKGKTEASLLGFQTVIKNKCPQDVTAKSLYWYGSLSLKPENQVQGDAAFETLFQNHPEHSLADDAVHKLYNRHKNRGNTDKAQFYYNKLMSLEKGDMRDQLVFEEGFAAYQEKNFHKAAKIMSRIINKKASTGESFPQVLYWYARSLEKTGEKKFSQTAADTYENIVTQFPFSFYAVLAAKRFGKEIAKPQFTPLQGEQPSLHQEGFQLIDAFNKQGFKDAARATLDFILHQSPDLENTHKEFITQKLIESGNYRKALEIAAQAFGTGVYGPISGSDSPLFSAFYPRAYQKQIAAGYELSGLPKGAIEGIMREESLFQKNVGSWVGAQGLMQLMPTTAALVAKKLTAQNVSPTQLHDPQNNIFLGSTYLKDMKIYFNDQLPLAIMAYNAGPGNVNKWLRRFGDLPLDEFIENIPFSETRGYIKRVMRTMRVYGSFYGMSSLESPEFKFNIFNKFATTSSSQNQDAPNKKNKKKK